MFPLILREMKLGRSAAIKTRGLTISCFAKARLSFSYASNLLILFSTVNSSLPVVRQAEHNERLAADSRMDRMTIWMRNVESRSNIHSVFDKVF